ncbi:MAG: molybdopterin cofactor-binding domain-containing protein [Enterocloster bolteae]
MELSGYEEAVREQEAAADSRYRIGVGMAVAAHGNGVFGVRPDTTGVIIKMNEDGTAVMFTGVSDMGNGSVTTQTQVVSEILGIPMSHIECVQADTDATLWDMGNYSSRGTFVSCSAALKVAGQVKTELLKEASGLLEVDESELDLKDQRVYCTFQA